MNFNNNINNNIPPNKKEIGTEYDLSERSNNRIQNEINTNNNIINFENNNNINNLNQNVAQLEEEEIEDDEENKSNNNISSSYGNNYLKPIIQTENFSQQVNLPLHPKNPEPQTSNIQENKNYNNTNNKIISQKPEKNVNLKKK